MPNVSPAYSATASANALSRSTPVGGVSTTAVDFTGGFDRNPDREWDRAEHADRRDGPPSMTLSIAGTSVPVMTSTAEEDLTAELQSAIEAFDCVAGTIHREADGLLTLEAHVGMPEEVLERIETIPFGKGIAGLAAERLEPVQVCNLQTDDSGVAESGAKATGLEGTIAVPMLGTDEELEGVIGVGKPHSYEFSEEEADELRRVGREIAERW